MFTSTQMSIVSGENNRTMIHEGRFVRMASYNRLPSQFKGTKL